MNSTRKRTLRSSSPPEKANKSPGTVTSRRQLRSRPLSSQDDSKSFSRRTRSRSSSGRTSLETTTNKIAKGIGSSSKKLKVDAPSLNEQSKQDQPAKKTHNTRLRNGIQKVKKTKSELQQQSEDQTDNRDKEMEALVDACAANLAEVDRESFQQVLFSDAIQIFESFYFPLSFPWCHKADRQENTIRRLPCDIDDMLAMDEDSCDEDANDMTETQYRTSTIESSTRSQAMEGYVPFHCRPKSKDQTPRLPAPSSGRNYHEASDVRKTHHRLHEAVQIRSRVGRDTNQIPLLSVRFDGVSSRESIFTEAPEGQHPLLLPAILGQEIQNGKKMPVSRAIENAERLGSYDCRYGLPPLEPGREDNGRIRRAVTGRTRLLWTRKDLPKEEHSRPTYSSLITGEKLPPGSYKRPLAVRVGIRLNGQLLSTDIRENNDEKLHAALIDGEEFIFPPETVDSSLQNAAGDAKILGAENQDNTETAQHSTREAIAGSVFEVGPPSSAPQNVTEKKVSAVTAVLPDGECSLDVPEGSITRYDIALELPKGRHDWIGPKLDCVVQAMGWICATCRKTGHLSADSLESCGPCSCCFMSGGNSSETDACKCKIEYLAERMACTICKRDVGYLVQCKGHKNCEQPRLRILDLDVGSAMSVQGHAKA